MCQSLLVAPAGTAPAQLTSYARSSLTADPCDTTGAPPTMQMKLEMSLALICALSVVFVAHGCSFTHDVVASGISASATPNGIPLDGYNASAARNLIVTLTGAGRGTPQRSIRLL
jgi:hypothetical protein